MIVAIHPADPIAAVLIHNKLLFYKLVACEYKTAIVSECLLQHAIQGELMDSVTVGPGQNTAVYRSGTC